MMDLISLFTALMVRNLIEMRRYYFNTLSSLVTIYVIFLMMFLYTKNIVADDQVFGHSVEGMIVGFMVYYLAATAYGQIAWSITSEAQQGTLEQLSMSKFPLVVVQLVYALSALLSQLAIASVLLFLMMFTTGQYLLLDVVSIIPLLLMSMGSVIGIGLMIGGMAIIVKQLQSIFSLVQMGMVALVLAPADLEGIYAVLPLSWGVALLRDVMIHDVRLWDISSIDMLVLFANSLAYLLVGIFIFCMCEYFARKKGLLGHY